MPKAAKSKLAPQRVSPAGDASKKGTNAKGKVKTNAFANANTKNPKAVPPPESYILLVRLEGTYDPAITRLLTVPTTTTFDKFHSVLQAAFGWANCHMHSFNVSKILDDEEVDDCMKDHISDSDSVKQTSEYTLADDYENPEWKSKIEIVYEYDYGDGWNHSICLLGKADPSMRKVMQIPDDLPMLCIGGEGHHAAENSGGPDGWEDLKDAFKKKGDKDGRKDWYKSSCMNGDPKGPDPYQWSFLEVNDELQKIEA